MSAPITGLYASLCALLLVVLSILVIRQRITKRVGIGHGGVTALERAIRVHGNFIEYVPMALLLLLLAELQQTRPVILHSFGIALLVGRVLHALGLGKTENTSAGRFIGTNLTFFTLIGLSIVNIIHFASR